MAQDGKLDITTVAIGAIAIVAYFTPVLSFDLMFPGVRTTNLHLDDWQMFKFWYQCLINFPELDSFALKAKLATWMLLVPGVPSAGIAGVALWKKHETDKMKTAQTSAVFSKLADLKEYQGTDGLLLSKHVQMRQNTCFTHLLVVGPTGSGKTQSFFLPNIMKLPSEYSAVITDPKGELYQKTANRQRALGREPVLLKLDIKETSVGWNPLDVPKDAVMMSKVCTSIVKNKGGGGQGGGGDQDFWDATAIDLLMAMVYVVKAIPKGADSPEYTYGNFKNVYELLSNCSFDSMLGLAQFAVAELGVKDVLSRSASFADSVAPEETRNSTRFVLKTALAPFMIDDVAHITARTDFDFCDLKRRPIALYVSVPEHKVTGLAPVISTLYMQIFDSLLDMGEGGRPVFFLMDEFANIGKVIGFPQYIATIRSRNLSVSVCLQSAEQLTRNYSEPEKQEILNNLKVTVVLPGLKEEKTLQYIQTISGKVSGYEKQSEKDEKRVFTKDRLPLNEIREMQDNYDTGIHETIVIFPNKPAYKDIQRRSYSDPEIKKLMDQTAKAEFPNRDEQHWGEIKDNSFFEPGDLSLLETIGTYIYYDGNKAKAGDKQQQVLRKFLELSQICGGIPEIQAELDKKNGEMVPKVFWKDETKDFDGKKVVLDERGKLARRIIRTTFEWKIREKMLIPS